MLTSLEIENFKGIAARQRIDFAPLTLLFGANNAGKSSILHALTYLHELIERGSADIDRTELGGEVLELGGFARLVHEHDEKLPIVLKAEFATPGGLERFGRDVKDFAFPDLDDEVESAWLELTIRFRTTANFRGPIVESAVFGVNGEGEPLLWLELGATLREGEPLSARLNLGHPMLMSSFRGEPATLFTELDREEVIDAWNAIAAPPIKLDGEAGGFGEGAGAGDGNGFGDSRFPVFALSRTRLSALPAPGEPLRVIPFGYETPEREAVAQQVRTLLEMIVLGTTSQLVSQLRESLYIGPLRAVPGLADLYERPSFRGSWFDGRAAWQALLSDRLNLVEQTNTWLKRLGADCHVFVNSVFEPSSMKENAANLRVHTLRLETPQKTRVLPSEVGSGISQVLPIVVASLMTRGGVLAVEQPELHVHPALQVGLGDLFIEVASRATHRRATLVETHSEHLILRLLRRIRETTENELPDGATAFGIEQLSVLYVESTPEGVCVRRLRVDEQGEFVDRWPKGFFAERIQELL